VVYFLTYPLARHTGWLQKKWLKPNMYCLAMV
jgi:hypothetical protein